MKAYLYYFSIIDTNTFWGYFMDYAIYGRIYPLLAFETDFYEINFAPSDILCYDLNSYDPVTNASSTPTYSTANCDTLLGGSGTCAAAGITCTTACSIATTCT